MVINLPISKARSKLSTILREIQKDPSKIYHITINEIVIGELRYPNREVPKEEASLKLKALGEELARTQKKKKKQTNIATEHDKYLYNLES